MKNRQLKKQAKRIFNKFLEKNIPVIKGGQARILCRAFNKFSDTFKIDSQLYENLRNRYYALYIVDTGYVYPVVEVYRLEPDAFTDPDFNRDIFIDACYDDELYEYE